jgi:hypothetical protein
MYIYDTKFQGDADSGIVNVISYSSEVYGGKIYQTSPKLGHVTLSDIDVIMQSQI